ncbi:hypothetical protein Sliba_18120 [Streptomyces nigrescens]|uniref:Uncharacterized protein n=1 Tax=Streptomyces nigrescens TaxID=1920 RepID=A0A640TCA7_STRNI|nr:hypothetical protein Sliba_18120 [Streptomyces libani subsp. libani]GGW02454.1 hypothetical protein GCM10010500_59890 [Streptomyces libani subsp. libani]
MRRVRSASSAGRAACTFLRGRQHRAQAQVFRRPGRSGEEERGGLGVGEPGQPGAVSVHQAVAAGGTAVGADGNSRREERLDVPVDRTDRHLQFRREFGSGHPPAVLEQQKQGEKPVGTHTEIVPRT